MDPKKLAELIDQRIVEHFNVNTEKQYQRAVVQAVSGRKASLYIEGSTQIHPDVLCMSPYIPAVGDKVLVLSIGGSRSNLLVLGRIDTIVPGGGSPRVSNETPSGTVNGTNVTFTLAATPITGTLKLYLNGVRQKASGNDFTLTGASIAFVVAPPSGSVITADYEIGSETFSAGVSNFMANQIPSGAVDSSNTVYTTNNSYVAGTLEVYVNGLRQLPTTHYTETNPTAGTFTLGDAPTTGDNIMVNYQHSLVSAGDADLLDGYHLVAILQAVFPVGSTFISGSSTMPALIASIGTWTRLKGRIIIGVDETQTEFDTVDELYGSKTVSLTKDQIPPLPIRAMTDGGGAFNGDYTVLSTGGPLGGWGIGLAANNAGTGRMYANNSADNNVNRTATAHENMPPVKAKYMWERTA